jgi:ADP-heptose:LPS heptosyltransferase
MQLETLLPVLRTPGFTWISLQKGEPAEQLTDLPDGVFVWDGSSQEQDLAETAALISTLDLVVTTDTCIAHLAGAMGKPVWILLPHLADWRWMQERETTPWYPTARLLRQSKPDDWAGVVERASEDLGRFLDLRQKPVSGLEKQQFPASRLLPA